MGRNLFLIHTPFQLMNCLNIIEEHYKDATNEMVFLHKNLTKYKNLVKEYKEDIIIYNYEFLYFEYKEKDYFTIRVLLVLNMIKGKKRMKKVENCGGNYDIVFVPSKDITCNIVYSHFYKNNSLLKLYAYDDGVGTYIDGYFEGGKHYLYEKVSIMLFGNFFWEHVRAIFSYRPEFIYNSSKNVSIFKINSKRVVENLFSKKVTSELVKKYNESKVIYLDQGYNQLFCESAKILFEICANLFKKEEVLIKNHPRIASGYSFNNFAIDDSGNSFESVMFRTDIENKILISMYSTSCLTPFLLKDTCPIVIFLGKLNTNINDDIFKSVYFKYVIDNYKGNRIFFPKTSDELIEILEILSKNK